MGCATIPDAAARLTATGLVTLVLVAAAFTPGAHAQSELPVLRIEAPEELQAVATRIRRVDRTRFAATMRLLGLIDAGRPIRVVLVPADARMARDAPRWVAAFADARNDLIVLFPDRIGSYPYDSLDVVLHHEVAHILTARAAGGGRLPRWFNEGLASTAERSWGIGGRSRLLWANVVSGEPSIAELEGLFAGGPAEAARAYAISHAMVRDLMRRHGPRLVPALLARVSAGATFDHAFLGTTGVTVSRATNAFWRTSGGWEEWITFAASPTTLWTLMTSLALAAIWRHRRRRAERRRRWEAEEALEREARRVDADPLEDPWTHYRVH